ncbi:hypothetical protein PoB_007168600 [Plakobranchus ocellatus]|uniref:Uncharacterized protein n=1 Tax=Plakobranchus ocellatus TaxID=259542 RepID=A0AAV4DMT3_9GAST|nr:hypothetical protein PoB_007168600 [Plakobranchus ocellatus]
MAPREGARRDFAATAGLALEVKDILQIEIKDGMLQMANGKPVSVVKNCATLGDPKRMSDLCVPILTFG